MTDEDIITHILTFEGGFVNNPLDKGGPTNFGITAAELGQYNKLGRPATIAEIQQLTKVQASEIYQTTYITQPGFDGITDVGLRFMVVDSGVLHGVTRAAKWLQQAINVPMDGYLGDVTFQALNKIADGSARNRAHSDRIQCVASAYHPRRSQGGRVAGIAPVPRSKNHARRRADRAAGSSAVVARSLLPIHRVPAGGIHFCAWISSSQTR
jgi:lysozyme family protein